MQTERLGAARVRARPATRALHGPLALALAPALTAGQGDDLAGRDLLGVGQLRVERDHLGQRHIKLLGDLRSTGGAGRGGGRRHA